jgi:hypothetical protein
MCNYCSRAFEGNLEKDEQHLKDHRLRAENNMETAINCWLKEQETYLH